MPPKVQYSSRPVRSTGDMMFAVPRLQKLEQATNFLLYTCFIDLQKTYDTVDRELLWFASLWHS